MAAIQIPTGFSLTNPGLLDADYGPYSSLSAALLALPLATRAPGKTFGVYVSSVIKEYTWDSNVSDGAVRLKVDTSSFLTSASANVPNGYAQLDSSGLIPSSLFSSTALGDVVYKGTYNGTVITSDDSSLNGNALPTAATGNKGYYFICTSAFTLSSVVYSVGDWIISNGAAGWSRVANADAVSTVFGRNGNIVANATDYSAYYPSLSGAYVNPSWISSLAWVKLTGVPSTVSGYGITDVLAQPLTGFANSSGSVTSSDTILTALQKIYGNYAAGGGTGTVSSLTTSGSSGAATFISGVLNIPNYTLSGLGGISASSTDVLTNKNLTDSSNVFPTFNQSTTGNAATATALQTSRNINGVAFDGSANITVAAAANTLTGTTLASNVVNSSLTSVGTLLNLTVTNPISGSLAGNASTATALQTARSINGVNFDGSANITIAAAAGTLTGTTLPSNVVNSSLTSVGTLANLTVTNVISGSVSGNAGTVTNGLYSTGTYSNPSWLTGLAWSKISATPTTVSGYGITDILSQTLAGLSTSTGGVISTSDTIISGFGKLQNQISGIVGGMIYKGVWNASINSPTITSGSGTLGWFYKVGTAGTTTVDGNSQWNVGDLLLFDGTTWDKIDGISSEVVSVFGRVGSVTAQSGDYTTSLVTEGTNLYFTNARAIASTLTGYAAAAGTVSSTDTVKGAIQKIDGNVAALVTGVSSFNTRTGAITPASGDYTFAQIGSKPTTVSGYGIADILTQALTGFSSTTGTVTSSDGILTAFQKLYGNDALKAPLASPTFTGTPAAPTAAQGTNTTQVATTAYVQGEFTASAIYFSSNTFGGSGTSGSPYAITLTTTGTSGAASFVSGTLNIPQYSGTVYTFTNGVTAPSNAIQLDTTYAATYTAAWTFQTSAAGSSGRNVVLNINTSTVSTSGSPVQRSGTLHFQGYGWGTTAATNQSTDWQVYVAPISSTTAYSQLNFDASNNGGVYSTVFYVNSFGSFVANGTFYMAVGNVLASNTTDGFVYQNGSAATSGAKLQNTTVERFRGSVWNQTGTPTAWYYDFIFGARGTSNTTVNPNATFYWSNYLGSSTTTGTVNDLMSLDNFGNLTLLKGKLNFSVTSYAQTAWANNTIANVSGAAFNMTAATYQDTSTGSGATVTYNFVHVFAQPTLSALNTVVTYTNAATVYIAGSPIAGANVTLTSSYSLWVNSGASFFGGNVTVAHLGGNISTAPTKTAGAGAGTSPTITVTGSDMVIKISVLTGTSPSNNSIIATITFNQTYAVTPKVFLVPVNAAAAALTGSAKPFVDDSLSGTSSFSFSSGATALAASTTYLWYAFVVQ